MLLCGTDSMYAPNTALQHVNWKFGRDTECNGMNNLMKPENGNAKM